MLSRHTRRAKIGRSHSTGSDLCLSRSRKGRADVCGIDFDKITAQAKTLGRKLNTYTENSASGRGFHCIARAKPFQQATCKTEDLEAEAYCKNRYFAFTGLRVKGSPVEPSRDQTKSPKSSRKSGRRRKLRSVATQTSRNRNGNGERASRRRSFVDGENRRGSW